MQNQKVAKLYVVATPIGNLSDITLRAITVLKEVQWVAAEDTRQSKKLLLHYGIKTPLLSVHAHNERQQTAEITRLLRSGQDVAYITDAGTPLVSDPGAYLVQMVRAHGFKVIPVPGACAAIAALSVSGFTCSHFYFEGFLPNRSSARKQRLKQLQELSATLIFYEAPHRILSTIGDLLLVLGDRTAVIAREITKIYETVLTGTLQELEGLILADRCQQLGEFVLLISGQQAEKEADQCKLNETMKILLKELPLKQAVYIGAQLLGMSKNDLYPIALSLKS